MQLCPGVCIVSHALKQSKAWRTHLIQDELLELAGSRNEAAQRAKGL